MILWGERDTVIPDASLQSLRVALGDPQCITVRGKHPWLLADPDIFGEVITDVIGAAPAVQRGLRPQCSPPGFAPRRAKGGPGFLTE